MLFIQLQYGGSPSIFESYFTSHIQPLHWLLREVQVSVTVLYVNTNPRIIEMLKKLNRGLGSRICSPGPAKWFIRQGLRTTKLVVHLYLILCYTDLSIYL